MRPSDKCPEEATRGRHLFPASVTIKAECRGFTTLRHRQNTAPSSPPLPLLSLTMRGVVVIFHRGFQGCGIRLLSSFPHVTAPPTHLWAVQPLPVHPATRQITDVECEGDEKDGSGQGTHSQWWAAAACQYWATSDQTCLSHPPSRPLRPPRINHYANNMLQYVTNCLVSDWWRILLKSV